MTRADEGTTALSASGPVETAGDREAGATAAALLRRPDQIRSRAAHLTARARAGESRWFVVDDARVADVVAEVAAVTRQRYPDLQIPFHSRWRHFEAGGIDRGALLDSALGEVDPAERARTQIDLTVISVLLDAGAGASWFFDEPGTGLRFTRSEGLAVASFHAFRSGLFSSDPKHPLRVDAAGLRTLTPHALATAFGVTEDAPLVGLETRVELLHRLASALVAAPSVYPSARPGGLFDHLTRDDAGEDEEVAAEEILGALLDTLSPIWLANNTIDRIPLGDCWRHEGLGDIAVPGWMPFHKLSQWLTYSLLEPFLWAQVPVTGIGELTALPEYRNGGLLLDTGLIALRDPALAEQEWEVGQELIVEWRALTVALLDEIAPAVATELGLDPAQVPLACILEGGTWAAGRRLAAARRGGAPPLRIRSDGTVF
ncbi:DUF1688 family protein [Dermacoccaceae bacterium W4C1]